MTNALDTRLQPLIAAVERNLAPDNGDFVGRQFVRDAVREFASVANRMLVLVGPPGVGKTAFAAELLRESLAAGTPHLAHFCGLSDGTDPNEFVRALALQVQDALGSDYRLPQTLAKQLNISVTQTIASTSGDARVTGVEIKELKLGGVHPREAFRVLVREPLGAYHERLGAAKPLVIIIDALDRAWEWDSGQGANIVSLLADVQDLPPWVNLICTARPGPAVQALRAQAGVRVFDIAPLGEPNLRDVRTFFEERLVAKLDTAARERLRELLRTGDASGDDSAVEQAFVERAVAASQGNFLFVRRYAAELRAALMPQPGQPQTDAAALLRFDGASAASLASVLDRTYAAILAQIRQRLDADQRDADEDVLTALAILFEPANVPLLCCFTSRSPDAVEASLTRLEPVLTRGVGANDITVALYHRGFADWVRRGLPRGGRDQDVRAARALEVAGSDDRLVLAYAARQRWAHLLRGLDMSAGGGVFETTATPAPAVDPGGSWQRHVEQIKTMTRESATQAQLLRALAVQAIDPARSDTPGSWAAALGYLRAAERILRHSRALVRITRRGGRYEPRGATVPDELLELERTLIALGDAYTTVARRMDGGVQRTDTRAGLASRLYLVWDTIVRLPLTMYLLFVLLWQGVREIHIPGAVQNLGREQDWAVARLLVLAVSAYRRAGALARQRNADAAADDVLERLGRVYRLMGAYDVAAAAYETLLARPATATSPWRRAVWLLAMGEVLLAQRAPERAVETISSALPTFADQQAPVLLARAHSNLAGALHMQAELAAARRDFDAASPIDDLAIASAGAALTAWLDVTTLQGDDLAAIDPPLAISGVAHILEHTGASRRVSEEQYRRVQAELQKVPERHFAQRFEHPLLRLFRVAATVGLPAYVLGALLLAVQPPNAVLVRVPASLAVQAPLVSLDSFPNNLVAAGGATPSALSATDVAQLVLANQIEPAVADTRFRPPAPADLPTFSATALALAAAYLTLYSLAGMVVVALVSPAHLQHRRPGRVVLRPDALIWRGVVSRGALGDLWEWMRDGLPAWWTRLVNRSAVSSAGTAPAAREYLLPLEQIAGAVSVDRRALGFLLGDFSATTVQPAHEQRPRFLPGTLDYYDELTAALAQRIGTRFRSFSMEVVASLSGIIFALAVLYAMALALLLPLAPGLFEATLPRIGYSLADLYVIAAPALAIPLVWWFVAQPLGAAHARASTTARLLVTVAAAAALTFAVLLGLNGINLLRLEPDLFTPTLALATLGALLVYTPPRPLRRLARLSLRNIALAGVTLASAVGVALLCYNLAVTTLWYHARVQGDNQFDRVLDDPECATGEACSPLDRALHHYGTMICLRPGATDGYALYGLAQLAAGEYEIARNSFGAALDVGGPDTPELPGCLPGLGAPPEPQDALILRANLGAAEVLLAQDEAFDPELYGAALTTYAAALELPIAPGEQPNCTMLTRSLLQTEPDAPLDRDEPAGAITPQQVPLAMQLADACYHRALAQAATLGTLEPDEQARAARAVWDDLTAAVAQYSAIDAATEDDAALRGLAAGWLLLGQLPAPPQASDRRSYLLRAQDSYAALAAGDDSDAAALGGQAWSTMLLGATTDAQPPLELARQLEPDNPVYPALQGMAFWLDGIRFPLPAKAKPSPAYSAALEEALAHYSDAIDLSDGDLSLFYATRSTLHWSLRNSPRGESYQDDDYEARMRAAIADIEQALAEAELHGQDAADQVGYRYWRGRLSFSLALTWQRRLRGVHPWQQLVPLYANALEDFETAARDDPNDDRRKEYDELWTPWSRYMLANATQLALAEAAVEATDWERARRALALVEPRLDPNTTKGWDRQSIPQPEYHLLHALLSLALGAPQDFVNPVTGTPNPETSYTLALKQIADPNIVPADARPVLYEGALADLDRLIDSPGILPTSRATAINVRELIRAQFQQR
jgi:GTPase SAR1 family protein